VIGDLLEDLTGDRGGLVAVADDSGSESATLSITFEVV